ncbi:MULTISPECIES: hypothetical protein [Providencia]|uniref:DUF4145 domain-containing protein n=4 Tax=Providencia TaxID=586 RepID=A0ABD5L4C8_PROST|nr:MULTISPECIES: hypothetical protein [Providencia]MBZ3680464.1 hypothetical protein [Providencia rettgeri]URE77007.1 hypothetical protein MWH14_11090 [Providencia stuartii]MCR4180174.1 hypothetical protein [Providencia vermicola]MDT0133853.1 hypothetical protein [Providencia huaxiensis]MDT1980259.1 hypothetical protein [Providencia huaxiensis]
MRNNKKDRAISYIHRYSKYVDIFFFRGYRLENSDDKLGCSFDFHVPFLFENQYNVQFNNEDMLEKSFSFLDCLIDERNPNLIGKSFAKKIKGMTVSNHIDLIIKECFRILRIFRNASEHEGKKTIQDGTMNIEINFNEYKETLTYNNNTLSYLFFIIYLISINFTEKGYPLTTLISAYNKMKNNTTEINDCVGNILEKLDFEVTLSDFQSLVVLGLNYTECDEFILFKPMSFKDRFLKFDYLYKKGNNYYLLPSEYIENYKDTYGIFYKKKLEYLKLSENFLYKYLNIH